MDLDPDDDSELDSEPAIKNVEQVEEFVEYDITATPNDFNVQTIFDLLERGVFQIPPFQRNYVWDVKQASKLIESLIIGLPIPQIFLFEEERNKFLVIDGQQRLMTIYFYLKGRMPKRAKRAELRAKFAEAGPYPDVLLHDDKYFTDFKLELTSPYSAKKSPLHGKGYQALGDYKDTLALRVIRNIVIRQNSPSEGYQSKFEIFQRLNTGGVKLSPQEIRSALFHSPFYIKLHQLNLNEQWRKILPSDAPDVNLKDIEILLRGFALLDEIVSYTAPMTRYINRYSYHAMSFSEEEINEHVSVFEHFLNAMQGLSENLFVKQGRFHVLLFESVFYAAGRHFRETKRPYKISEREVGELADDQAFIDSTSEGSAKTKNVTARLRLAKEKLTFCEP